MLHCGRIESGHRTLATIGLKTYLAPAYTAVRYRIRADGALVGSAFVRDFLVRVEYPQVVALVVSEHMVPAAIGDGCIMDVGAPGTVVTGEDVLPFMLMAEPLESVPMVCSATISCASRSTFA